MRSGRRDVPDLELERLEPAEHAAGEAGDDIDPIALGETEGEVRPAEGDAVEHVAFATEHQLGMAAVGGTDALHRQAEDRHERLRVPGPARAEARQVPVQGVVHVRGRQGQVDGERTTRVLRERHLGEREEP